ncbi:DUF6875 domain-containing protein [Nocardia sp. NPDC049220]|uniref:DUF6875 domain-containing protein n=1 Tax=Nocardia sp. NPDC049220 TaxID=3155273 RepID=UPI0033F3E0A3
MTATIIDQIDPATQQVLREWLTGYVTQPHPELGRRGAVCPFVKPSLAAGGIVFRTADWEPRHTPEHLERIVSDSLTAFEETDWQVSKTSKQALIVALLTMPDNQWHLIDEVHRKIKDKALARGLMIGQFHPQCPAPAVHNPQFAVNRAPTPLIVVRHMAKHDILFLADEAAWFQAYRDRFGHKYELRQVHEPHLINAYTVAAAKWSTADPQVESDRCAVP